MNTSTCKRHKWKDFGGIKENPGIMGIGGAAICHSQKCEKCDTVRQRVFGDVNKCGNRNHGWKIID